MTLEEQARALADRIVLDVCELPDRTSPEDWPEAMLVTGEELHLLVFEEMKAALTSAEAAGFARGVEVVTTNLREAWSALAMIRDAIETLGPVGAMRSSEAVCCLTAPTFNAEAEEIIRGIQAIRALTPVGSSSRTRPSD